VADDLSACMSIIRLLALQCQLLKQSAARVVNLTQDEAMAFVKSCTKYSEVKLVVVFWGRLFDRVDLIKPVSKSVRSYVCPFTKKVSSI